MSNNKVKTTPVQKTEAEVLNEQSQAELTALTQATPAEVHSHEVVAPPQDDVEELYRASQAAAEARQQSELDRANVRRALQVNVDKKQTVISESVELIRAVKADAEARGKNFSICPITGVLIVG